MKQEIICALLALAGMSATATEATTSINCGNQKKYPSNTEFINSSKEPSVFVNFLKITPPFKELLPILKDCLKVASQQYRGKNNIYAGVLYKGIDDTEFAETTAVYYDQKSKSVKVEEREAP